MLVRVQDLGGLNQRFGGPHTDKLLLNIANLLNAHREKYAPLDSTLARIRGGEFALLCPGVTHGEMLELCNSLSQKLTAFYATGMSDQQPVAYTSMVPFSAGENAQSLLIQPIACWLKRKHTPTIRSFLPPKYLQLQKISICGLFARACADKSTVSVGLSAGGRLPPAGQNPALQGTVAHY